MRRWISVGLVVLKVVLVYWASARNFRVLSSEDSFFEERGTNTHRQRFDEKAPLTFTRFVWVYQDSMPLDLFELDNPFRGSDTCSARIEHLGITDSGPAFSAFATGKLANKYEGSIAGVDNVFRQLKAGGWRVHGAGYHYPIAEMLDSSYFTSYRTVDSGIRDAWCQEFIDVPGVFSSDETPISSEDQSTVVASFVAEFRRELRGKWPELRKCVESKLSDGASWFIYDVYTDWMGHQFSRESPTYLRKIAAAKANLEALSEILAEDYPDILQVTLSDHGLVSAQWESELSNHGSTDKRNESFIHLRSPRLASQNCGIESLRSFDVSAILAQLLDKVNVPLLSVSRVPPIFESRESADFARRLRLGQLSEFLRSFDSKRLEEVTEGVALNPQTSEFALNDLPSAELAFSELLRSKSKDDAPPVFLCLLIALLFIAPVFVQCDLFSAAQASLGLLRPIVSFFFGDLGHAFFWPAALFAAAGLRGLAALRRGPTFEKAKAKAKAGLVALAGMKPLHLASLTFGRFFLAFRNPLLQAALVVGFAAWTFSVWQATGRGRTSAIAALVSGGVCVAYEWQLSTSATFAQSIGLQWLSRLFYLSLAVLGSRSPSLALLSLTFWLGNNLQRALIMSIVLPFLAKISKDPRGAGDAAMTIVMAYAAFECSRGSLDTNISVRAASKTPFDSIERVPVFTAIVFSVQKFLPFLAILPVLGKTELRVTQAWYGIALLHYMKVVQDPLRQREGFMNHAAAMILLVGHVAFAAIYKLVSKDQPIV